MKYLNTLLAVVFALAVSTVNAAQPDDFPNLILQQGNGFIVSVPVSAPNELVKSLSSHHADLRQRRSATAQQINDTKIGAKDVLIAAILPGGLIYLANKKQRHSRAQEDLQALSSQLAELKWDMNHFALKSIEHSVALLK